MHEFATAETFPRSAGILLHPTSLPGRHGIGDLGIEAARFIDFLTHAGVSYWQILPLVPPGPGNSPYSTPSAFAGSPYLINLDILGKMKLLTDEELHVEEPFPLDHVDYDRMREFKTPRLMLAAGRLVDKKDHPLFGAMRRFEEKEPWASEHALYMAIKRQHDNKAWWEWPAPLRDRDEGALAEAREKWGRDVDIELALQFLFEMQWQSLRVRCRDNGVRLIGDVPIYVDGDSVDVWRRQDQFILGENHSPSVVSGVPPDPFSDIGQKWGNPLYNWPKMKADGHQFWVERMRRALSLTDVVRVDHFRGFSAYWEVPATAPDARTGRWVEGPGIALFDDLKKELGELPIIAEDLGVIDEAVETLRDDVGLPGMKILLFAFGDDPLNPYLPHSIVPNSVVYTGTHDTDTLLGWWHSTQEHVRDHVRRYLGVDGSDVIWDLIRVALSSAAHTAVIPMQDLLELDGGARMNVPGAAEGNWTWRARSAAFHEGLVERLGEMLLMYDRDELKRMQMMSRKGGRRAK